MQIAFVGPATNRTDTMIILHSSRLSTSIIILKSPSLSKRPRSFRVLETMSTPGALSAVAEEFKSLFESSQATDFTIFCDTNSWKVHSFVLKLYSDVLACACDGDFKEAAARSIDLSVDGGTSVSALVHYMYYFDYATDDECHEPYTLHVNMVLLADKYDIPHLLDLANEKLVDLLGNEAIAVTPDLIQAAKLAYDAEGPTTIFREALVNATIKSSTLKPEQYDAIIRALPAHAQDVATAMP
ncbi:hypothetical protein LTR95_013081 [Oleoguttula sp. CCFEE 5521]